MADVIHIDGSIGEGGGSILRLAAGLSCVTRKPIHIINIRKNRKNPGLKLQHLLGIKALVELTDGKASSMKVGSTSLEFFPGNIRKKMLEIDIATAGNIGLLAQTLQNALINADPDEYHFKFNGGGTYGKWAPGIDFLNEVTFKIFRKIGYHVSIDVSRHGFYPKGGAKAELTIIPSEKYNAIQLLEKGPVLRIKLFVHADRRLKKANVAERIESSFRNQLNKKIDSLNKSLGGDIDDLLDTYLKYHDTYSIGVGVDALIECGDGIILGAPTLLGERGISSESLGKDMANRVIDLMKSSQTVDAFASDQIIPLLFFAEGESRFLVDELTSHFLTNLRIISKFISRPFKTAKIGKNLFEVSIMDQ